MVKTEHDPLAAEKQLKQDLQVCCHAKTIKN